MFHICKPSLLRAIKYTISSAKAAGIPVEMCGEAAADRLMTPLLISFGLDSFSVSPSSVLAIRREISLYTKEKADRIAEAVMQMSSSEEIKEYLVQNNN